VTEAKKIKEKSVLSRIGSLKGFKEAVAKAGSRVKQWKQRKEKEQEEKKAAKAAEEKKKKRKEKKDRRRKNDHDSSDESEDEAITKKEKSLRSSLKLKSSKKSTKSEGKKLIIEEEGEETEVDEKPKKPAREPSPAPGTSVDAEMKDLAGVADTEGDHPDIEQEKPKDKSSLEKMEKDEIEEKEDEKKENEEKEEKPKKRLSLSEIETTKPSEGESKDGDKDATPISSAASIHSIQDVDMFSEELEETKSIASTAIAEEMDLDDDDSKTIRGDDEKDTGSSGALLLAPRTVGDTRLIGVKRIRDLSLKRRAKPSMVRRKSQHARTVKMTPPKPQQSAKIPKSKSTPSPKALKRRKLRLKVRVMRTRQKV
jgi:hypothetical protein